MKMLAGVTKLSLEFLNEATQAWMNVEYNRAVHRETGCSPLERFIQAPTRFVRIPAASHSGTPFGWKPRSQRRSDGTNSVDGVRFEIPARYRHFREVTVRYARWDPVLITSSTGAAGLCWLRFTQSIKPLTPVVVVPAGRSSAGTEVPAAPRTRRTTGECPPS